jgi:hypothetical protein
MAVYLPGPVLDAVITSESLLRNPKAVESPNPSMVVVPSADTRSSGRYFQVMAQSGVDKMPIGARARRKDLAFDIVQC